MGAVNASRSRRFFTPLEMYLREYYRNTINLVFLVLVPTLFVLSFGDALSQVAGLLQVILTPNMGIALAAMWSSAFLSGIMGFYMIVGAREADRRLVRAGYSTFHVVASRLLTVALLGSIATITSYLVLLTQLTPKDYLLTFAILYLAAIIYGAIGILIGSLISGELEGSFSLLFFFTMDAFIGSPLFGTTLDVFAILPTFYPAKILSAMTAGRDHEPIHWVYALVYAAIAMILASLAFYRVARTR
jgi:hypothetical protein